MNKTVLTFVDDVYEDLELWYPKLRLEEAGYPVRVAGKELKTYSGKHGYPATADLLLGETRSAEFVGLVLPGVTSNGRQTTSEIVVSIQR